MIFFFFFQNSYCLWYLSFCRNLVSQLIVSSFFYSHPGVKGENKDRTGRPLNQANCCSHNDLHEDMSEAELAEENNLSHPPHPAKESTSISPRFPYWLINCSAKYSALHYSSCRQDVSFAAKFQGQMRYRNVIEIKLVGCAAATGRAETCLWDTQHTHNNNRHHPPQTF